MKIGILGSGDVGRKLADSFIENNHLVKIGSRNPNQEKLTEWMAKHDKAKVSSGTRFSLGGSTSHSSFACSRSSYYARRAL